MNVEPISIKEMTSQVISKFWKNLNQDNFKITSEETVNYNCVAWAIGKTDIWIDFFYDENADIDPDQSINKYVQYFESLGFIKCENIDSDETLIKIAIFEDDRKEFTHVALQLPNGHWTSKLGEYEDIEHYTLEAISGKMYGSPVYYMQKPK